MIEQLIGIAQCDEDYSATQSLYFLFGWVFYHVDSMLLFRMLIPWMHILIRHPNV
jgi:hypothetical protein